MKARSSSLWRHNTYQLCCFINHLSVQYQPTLDAWTQAPRTPTRILLLVTQYALPTTVWSARQHESKTAPTVRAISLLRSCISTYAWT